MPRTIRSFAAALVLLVLAAGAAPRPLAVRPAPAGFFDSLWEWVSWHLPAWNKAGGDMDPNGSRLQAPSLPTSDAGGEMDPDG